VKHFCEELKAAREYKKVSLEQISATTKIDIAYLKALEDGRWDVLPEPYIKGFLKAYAQCVGMNVLKVLKKYDELEKGVKPVEGEAPEELQKLAPPTPPPPPIKSRFPAVKVRTYSLLYLLLVAAIVVVGLIVLRKTPKPVEKPIVETEKPPITVDTIRAVTPKPDSTVKTDSVKVDSTPAIIQFSIQAIFQEPCYVEIVVNDSIRQNFLFQAGQSKMWISERPVKMKLGNAGGATIKVNGKDQGVLGTSGQTITLMLGPEGIIDKTEASSQ
jgi:cytoskeleton protein RodZ